MTDTLFDLDDLTGSTCTHPNVAPSTGYRYGCRCTRCRTGKTQAPDPTCHVPWCNQPRAHRIKWCTTHHTQCHVNGCTNPRRKVQAAKYCIDHTTSISSTPTGYVFTSDTCTVCGIPMQRRSSTTTALCAAHSHLRALAKNLRRHHVTADQQRILLSAPTCWICNEDLTWLLTDSRNLARSGAGNQIHVDHDHRHCPGEVSCGTCVRGLAHARCNLDLGNLERIVRRLGAARVSALVNDHAS